MISLSQTENENVQELHHVQFISWTVRALVKSIVILMLFWRILFLHIQNSNVKELHQHAAYYSKTENSFAHTQESNNHIVLNGLIINE